MKSCTSSGTVLAASCAGGGCLVCWFWASAGAVKRPASKPMDNCIRKVLMKASELNEQSRGRTRSLLKIEIQLCAILSVLIFQRIKGSADRAQRLNGNPQRLSINQAL